MHPRLSLRATGIRLILGLALLAGALVPPARSEEVKKVAVDPALRKHLGNQATVVVFISVGCPVSNAYLPHLNELAKKYEPKGVRFVGINSNDQDSAEEVAKHAKEYAIAFPVLKDEAQRIADALGAERVPEAVVLDAQGKVRYRGRIDDRNAVAGRKEKPTREDLAAALDELLAGKEVSAARTAVSGCLIGRAKPRAGQPATWSNQVVRILQRKCQACHRDEGVAPFALTTYDQAKSWGPTIQEVVAERRMPPWHADPRHGKFANDRSLSQGEIDTLIAWIAGGCVRGEDKDLPPPVEFPKGKWTIGNPDVTLPMPKEFTVPATGVLGYQEFIVETSFKEDRWVEKAQVLPGSRAVHHAVIFVEGMGEQWLCTYVPGDSPLVLPPGMAKRIPAGAKLRFNLHYTTNGKVEKDRTVLGLIFAKQPPRDEVRQMVMDRKELRIPPEDADHREEKELRLPHAARVLSFFPHMHVRGKSWECQVVYPDGRTEIVLQVPRYDFNWQHTYRLAEPLLLPAGSTVRCIAHYDNSKNNPSNPDPKKTVTWGPQSWDEMMAFGIEYLVAPGSQPAAAGVEPFPRAQLAQAAKRLNDEVGKLADLPLRLDGDTEKAAGIRVGQRAAVVIPDRKLTRDTLRDVGQEVVPVGQLWLLGCVPAVAGKAPAPEKLHIVTVALGNQSPRLGFYVLGVRKNGAGALELAVYGKEREALVAVPLRESKAAEELPVHLGVTHGDGMEIGLTVALFGKSRGKIPFVLLER